MGQKNNRRAEEALHALSSSRNLDGPAVSLCVTASDHTRVQGEGGVNLSGHQPDRGMVDTLDKAK